MNTTLRERGSPKVELRAGAASQSPGTVPPPGWILPALVVVGVVARVLVSRVNGLTFDETFTAMAGRRPVGELLDFLRHNDSHPPLDYLLRLPLARAGVSDVVFRLPSIVLSSAALALFASWMRRRAWIGVVATAVMALNAFQLVYGVEARMYALLELVGVAAAMLAEAWLTRPKPWHSWAAGALVLVAAFDHVSGLLLALGLFAVAGFRRDRAAWRWRVAVTAAVVIWAALWGPSLVDQQNGNFASWIPRTTVWRIGDVITRHLTYTDGLVPIVSLAVVIGVIVLLRREPTLGRVVLCCAVLPLAVAAVVGIFASFLFDRTLTISAWAAPLAIAFLVEEIRRRSRLLGGAIAVLVVLGVGVSTYTFLQRPWDTDLSVDRLEQVVRPGDAVAVTPARQGYLVDWRMGVRGDRPSRHVSVDGLTDSDVLLIGRADRPRRIWLLAWSFDPLKFAAGFDRCAPEWTDHTTKIVCLEPPRE